ncbi:hypothetical protein ACFL0F_01240 [Patescibacteria group bacterium]
MPDKNQLKEEHQITIVRLVLRGVLPVILLISGLYLLTLRLAGWSIIFGIPMIIIGTVFLIYTYDEIVSSKVGIIKGKVVKCKVCGEPTPLIPGGNPERTVCPECEEKGI